MSLYSTLQRLHFPFLSCTLEPRLIWLSLPIYFCIALFLMTSGVGKEVVTPEAPNLADWEKRKGAYKMVDKATALKQVRDFDVTTAVLYSRKRKGLCFCVRVLLSNLAGYDLTTILVVCHWNHFSFHQHNPSFLSFWTPTLPCHRDVSKIWPSLASEVPCGVHKGRGWRETKLERTKRVNKRIYSQTSIRTCSTIYHIYQLITAQLQHKHDWTCLKPLLLHSHKGFLSTMYGTRSRNSNL